MNTGVGPRNRIFLGLLLAFLAGVLLDRTGWLPGAQPDPGPSFAPFWETWQLVDEHYVDRAAVKPQHMIQGAIRGMLDSLGDVGHTTYLTKEEFAQAEKNLQGKLYGIGARLS